MNSNDKCKGNLLHRNELSPALVHLSLQDAICLLPPPGEIRLVAPLPRLPRSMAGASPRAPQAGLVLAWGLRDPRIVDREKKEMCVLPDPLPAPGSAPRAASPCGCEGGAGCCTVLPPCALCPRTPPSPSAGFVPSVPLLRAARPHPGGSAPFPGVAARISQTWGSNPAPGMWLQPGEVGGGWEGAVRWPELFRACPHQPGPAPVPPVPAPNN